MPTSLQVKIIEQNATVTNSSLDRAFRLRINTRSPRAVENYIIEKYIEEKCKELSPKLAVKEFQEYL